LSAAIDEEEQAHDRERPVTAFSCAAYRRMRPSDSAVAEVEGEQRRVGRAGSVEQRPRASIADSE